MAIKWYGLVAPEEAPTGDRRMFANQALTYRSFPLPMAWQRVSSQGHAGSVVVASWDGQYQGQGGVWGAGEFLDPAKVPEVVEAVYLLQKRLIGPSVDLDPDLAYEIVEHPSLPGEFAMKVTRANVHGVTLVMSPAFPQVHITVDTEEEMAVLASAGITIATFAASGVNSASWRKFPLIGDRATSFDHDSAVDRIAAWSGGDATKFGSAFLWKDPEGNALNRETYRLPVIDIHDNKAYLIPRAVFSAGVIMSGGHGGLYDTLSEPDRLKVQEVLTDIYDYLRDQYADPRVVAPWQRGGRQGARNEADEPTRVASMEVDDMISEELDFYIASRMDAEFSVRSSGWSDMPTSTGAWDEGAARRALDAWAGEDMGKYGRAFLWSDGSGNKTGFKFPIAKPVDGTLTIFIRAVNNAKARLNQADIPAADKTRIEGILNSIQRRYSPDTEASLAMDEPCPEGKHKMPDGSCMDDDDPEMDDDYSAAIPTAEGGAVTASGVLKPPDSAFANPGLPKATPLVVTEDGRVFGHLATWKTCHMGVGNRCTLAPQSRTNYAYFKTGSVLTDSGKTIRVGKITLGTGHADKAFGVVPAVEHYDHTGTCVAVVNAGEDSFGVWVAGALVAGVQESQAAELRRSPLSGDWRRVDGNLELVAALAVNSPGFPVLHEDGDGSYSLVAAGVLAEDHGGVEQPVVAADPNPAPFAEVDAFLNQASRAERGAAVRAAFHDLLPPEEGCGCNA